MDENREISSAPLASCEGRYGATCLGAVLSDTADHLRTSLKPMLAKLRSVSGIA